MLSQKIDARHLRPETATTAPTTLRSARGSEGFSRSRMGPIRVGSGGRWECYVGSFFGRCRLFGSLEILIIEPKSRREVAEE